MIAVTLTERKFNSKFYKQLLEFVEDALIIFSKEDERILDINNYSIEMLGYEKGEILSLKFSDIIYENTIPKNIIEELAGKESVRNCKTSFVNRYGQIIHTETNFKKIDYKGQDAIIAFISELSREKKNDKSVDKNVFKAVVENQTEIGRDITEQKKSENALMESENKYRRLIESTNVITWEFDAISKAFRYVSPQAERILGYDIKQWYEPSFWYNHIHSEDRDRVMAASHENFIQQKDHEIEYRMISADGSIKWFKDITSVIKDDYTPSSLYGILIDITEKKKTEQNLYDTQQRLSMLLNNLSNVVFYETGGGREFITENIFGLTGYSADEFVRDKDLFSKLMNPADRESIEKSMVDWENAGEPGILTNELRITHKDGTIIWLEDHIFAMTPESGAKYMSGVMIDITERKKTEQKIKDSLDEKEVLIKEIHHRVKNNLQIVSSLLKLQAGYIKDNNVLELLIESQNRVKSMALVHQKLYQSKDLSKIDFNDYLHQLLYHLLRVFKIGPDKVKLNIYSDDIRIGIDTAIPCGLIINELVSNSFKHAFPGELSGVIAVSLCNCDNGFYKLTVKDDGIGFPPDLDYRKTTSLGLQLVMTLTEQMDGKIELLNHKGSEFNITFAKLDYKDRIS